MMIIEPTWLAILADSISIAGFCLTVGVWWQTRDINRRLLRDSRVPDVVTKLKYVSDDLRRKLGRWPGSEAEIEPLLEKADAILSNILEKLDGSERKRALRSVNLIRSRQKWWIRWRLRALHVRENRVWKIYGALIGTTEALRQLNEDYKKRA